MHLPNLRDGRCAAILQVEAAGAQVDAALGRPTL
jgi:hypothetical protein